MATNPIPKGSVQLTVNCKRSLVDAIDELARLSRCSRSEYVRRLLLEARKMRWGFPEPKLQSLQVAETQASYDTSPRPPASKLPAPTAPAKTGS